MDVGFSWVVVCRRESFAERRSEMTNIAEARSVPTEIMRPAVKLPAVSRARPIKQGPRKPPRLPMELIAAIPAAVLAPVRKSDGIARMAAVRPSLRG